jgi:hypothetical protein
MIGNGQAGTAGIQHTFVDPTVKQIHITQKAVNKRRRGVVVDFIGCAVLFDFAFVHQHDAVGDFERFFLVMRNKDTGDVQFIMQLVDPTGNHRVLRAIAPLTQPVLTPLRAALPRSQFDYSPLIVVLVFNILRWVLGI